MKWMDRKSAKKWKCHHYPLVIFLFVGNMKESSQTYNDMENVGLVG